jgi:histidine triad (HIT) family protein
MEDTIFSKIIRGEIASEKIYEDADTFAFLDIAPNTPGHTLVIPKKAFGNVFDVDEETWKAVAHTTRKLAPIVRDAVGAQGMNINSNHEAEGGQEVFHLHFHLIPRFTDDGLKFTWPKLKISPEEMGEVARKIRAALA